MSFIENVKNYHSMRHLCELNEICNTRSSQKYDVMCVVLKSSTSNNISSMTEFVNSRECLLSPVEEMTIYSFDGILSSVPYTVQDLSRQVWCSILSFPQGGHANVLQ